MQYVLAAMFFRVSLDVSYIYYMHPVFETHFLTPMAIDFDYTRFAISHLIVLFAASFVPNGKLNLSGIFFMSALMFLLIPMTVMFGFNRQIPIDAILAVLLAIGICYVVINSHFYHVRIPLAKTDRPISMFVAIGFVFLFLVWSVISGAASAINFDLAQIYLYRESAGALLDVGVMAHINLWAQKVFNPYLLAHGLYKRNKAIIVFAIGMQVYFFGVTQHRAHLFVPILVYMVYRLYSSNISLARLFAYSAVAVLGFLALALATDLDAAPAIILRRAFFVPASVTFDWVAFFAERPKVYFSDNLLAGFSSSVYQKESLPLFVGQVIAPGRKLAFNCGMVGAGFAQMGFIGVGVYAFILGVAIKFVNALIRGGVPVFIAAAILFAPLRTAWADSDLFTALLSHGIIVCIVVLWLIGKRRSPT